MENLDPASLQSPQNVLPPYNSDFDPTSFTSTGTYNASDYGAAWTDPKGTVLSCSGKLMGGKKHTSSSKKSKKKLSIRKRPSSKKQAKKHKWSIKYKRSINCKRPKGFSQKQFCKYSRKKRA
jgi:hypothetical protein